VVVAGVGSPYRLDDGAGPAVASAVAARLPAAVDIGPIAEPLDLLGRWDGAELAVLVDATRSGSPPGTVQIIDLDRSGTGAGTGTGGRAPSGTTSTHGVGLAGAIRLARALEEAPPRIVVVGIEGERFGDGEGLSPAVRASVAEAVRLVLSFVEEVHPCA